MHTLQYIAIGDVEDKEAAANYVENLLQQEMGDGESTSSWYDWFVVGGGRFNPDETMQYENDFEAVISYEENADLFNATVAECLHSKGKEFQELLTEFKNSGIDIIDKFEKYDGGMDYSMDLYAVKKMIDIMQGKWDYTTRLYDVTNWSTNTNHMYNRIDNGEKNWFLVPIDFHF
jgi:hypothetical protein